MSVSHTITYRNAAILRPGEFTDADGRAVRFTADDLARIAENYDPQYHCATLNLDHAAAGPARGYVASLGWDGAYLRADLAGVPPELAAELSAGRYPFRSAEVYADLDGRGLYLRALALLGARPPAVKGLPPLPPPEQAAPSPAAVTPGLAGPTRAVQLQRSTIDTARQSPRAPRIFTITTEVRMPDAQATPFAKLAQSSPAQPAQQETIRLAEENQRLTEDAARLGAENRALKSAERAREVRYFLAELRGSGQLTPALERSGVEQALIAADEQPLLLTLPGGLRAPLGDVLRELLRALPVSFAPGEAAPAAAAAPAAPRLEGDELAIARALGLSPEEYAAGK